MKKCFVTERATIPSETVSQAVIGNNMIFVSGQISVNPETKELEKGNIKLQTRNTLKNLKIILEEAGSSLEDVLMCNIYLSSMTLFSEMEEVYEEFFGIVNPPARASIAVKEIYEGLDIEVTAVALLLNKK